MLDFIWQLRAFPFSCWISSEINVDSKIQRLKAEPLDQLVEAEGVEGAGEGVPGLFVCLFLVEFIIGMDSVQKYCYH